DPITEDSPAAEGAGRIHGHDAEGAAAGTIAGDQLIHQTALARPRRAGHADDGRTAGAGEDLREDRLSPLRPCLDEGDRPGQGDRVALHHEAGQFLHQLARSGVSPRSWRAMTRRWISEVPSPMVQILASR